MAWNDKPTKAQLDTIESWMILNIYPDELIDAAIKYLEEHATRKEVSIEMNRLRDLYYDKTLNSTTCFESKIWDGFDHRSFSDKMMRDFLNKTRKFHV